MGHKTVSDEFIVAPFKEARGGFGWCEAYSFLA
jgi:hypothetical protein